MVDVSIADNPTHVPDPTASLYWPGGASNGNDWAATKAEAIGMKLPVGAWSKRLTPVPKLVASIITVLLPPSQVTGVLAELPISETPDPISI